MGVGVSCSCGASWRCAMLHDEWPVCQGRDRCVAVIGDDSALVRGEADALNSNAGYTESLGMEFGKETEGSGSSALSFNSVRVRVDAGGESGPLSYGGFA